MESGSRQSPDQAGGPIGNRTTRFTNRDKMRAAQREAGWRRFVYERRVADGKMTRAKADEEIALMDEIAADYGALAGADDAEGRLV